MKFELWTGIGLFILLSLVVIGQKADSSAVKNTPELPIEQQIFGTEKHQDMRPPNSCVLVCR